MLDHELRPGKQHCQEGTPEFIGECVEKLKALGLKGSCLIRLDSGNDAEENFSHFGQGPSSSNAICAANAPNSGWPPPAESGNSKATHAKARTSTLVSSIISVPVKLPQCPLFQLPLRSSNG